MLKYVPEASLFQIEALNQEIARVAKNGWWWTDEDGFRWDQTNEVIFDLYSEMGHIMKEVGILPK